jgi:hypothetical protein
LGLSSRAGTKSATESATSAPSVIFLDPPRPSTSSHSNASCRGGGGGGRKMKGVEQRRIDEKRAGRAGGVEWGGRSGGRGGWRGMRGSDLGGGHVEGYRDLVEEPDDAERSPGA